MELALKFGARRADERADQRYPYVFETAGVPQVWDLAFDSTGTFGKLIIVGMNAKPVEINTMDLVMRKITIVGQHIYDHPVDFRATLEAVSAGRLAPEQTVQGTFPVTEASAALAAAREVPGKAWIDFSTWRAW
jgi:alcohol dehydrogenase/L-iditol 2-dehydrogenase